MTVKELKKEVRYYDNELYLEFKTELEYCSSKAEVISVCKYYKSILDESYLHTVNEAQEFLSGDMGYYLY